MERLIREKDVKKKIDEWLDTVGTAYVGKGLSYYGELMGCIEDAPTVDAVPVVRCKDCKYWGTEAGKETLYAKHCFFNRFMVDENFYCSYGEKKVEE